MKLREVAEGKFAMPPRCSYRAGFIRRVFIWSMVALSSTALAVPSKAASQCHIIPYVEAPIDLMNAFTTRMNIGPWFKFDSLGRESFYMSLKTGVRIGIAQVQELTETARLIVDDMSGADYARLEVATTFLLSRVAGSPEASLRHEIEDALARTKRTGQRQSVQSGSAVLIVDPSVSNGLAVYVGRRMCD